MLILPIKACLRYDLSTALADWLDDPNQQVKYDSSNPLEFVLPKPSFTSSDCRNDLLRLQSLRNAITEVLTKPNSHQHAMEEGGLEDVQEYHACLLEFERKGFQSREDDECSISMKWKGAYAATTIEHHSSLVWERACVAYNVVALLTHAIEQLNKTDRDACKQAVKHCQQAAGILSVLKELVQQQDYATVDFSDSHLQFWIKLCLASAQDYIYRMVSLGNAPKHKMLSGLAKSAYDLYNEALQETQNARLQSELPRQATEWGSYCKATSMLYAAKASYHSAVDYRQLAEWGSEICRLRESVSMLESCLDFCKTLPSDGVVSYTRRECVAILPVVQDRFHEADKDNLKVYHQEIPKQVQAEVEAVQMAKMSDGLPEAMLQTKRPMFVGL